MEVSILYEDVPVKVTSEDIESLTGIVLNNELEGESETKVTAFLDTLHSIIYDYLLYVVRPKSITNSLITNKGLENDVKKMLIAQAKYLLENKDIELFDGLIVKTAQTTENFDIQEVISKIVAPIVLQIGISTEPMLLYVG